MTFTALDTHDVVRELTAAGFTDAQAEAVRRQLRRAQDIDLSNFMMTAEGVFLENIINLIERKLVADFKRIQAETKVEFLKWMVVVAFGFQTVLILGTVDILLRIMAR